MKRFLWVLVVLRVLSVSVSALDREAFTFTKYDLEVRLEPEQQRIGVRGKITLRNDSQSPQKNATLQISSSLTWRALRVAGEPVDFIAQSYTSDIDHTGSLSEAIVTLPVEVAPKSTVEIEVGYEGTIPLDATRLTRIGVPQETAKHTDWDQISADFSAVRGIGYVAWYPVAMEAANLSEKDSVFTQLARWKDRESLAAMDFRVAYPTLANDADMPTMLCNGEWLGGATKGGRPKFPWMQCNFPQMGHTVPVFIVAQYHNVERLPIAVFNLPSHATEAERFAAAGQRVQAFVSEWFGTPRAGIIAAELPDPEATPFESEGLLLMPLSGASVRQMELAAVRQLAYASLTSPRPWIREGLTHFAQALYREHQAGRTAALEFMKSHGDVMLTAEKSRDGEKSATENSLVNTSLEEFYRSKSMYVWWMLRDIAGDVALKSALAVYKADQDKESSYVQRLVEAETKKDLEWFFDDWVYRDKGLPDFRIVSVYPRKTLKDTYLVTVTVENLGDAAAEVPVVAHFAGLESKERLLVKGKSQASIRLETSRMPEDVVVNDGSVPESNVNNNTFKVEATGDK